MSNTELMKDLGYYNGKFDLIENMLIPMTDRVCWFGDGVYEAAHARNHIIFTLDEHIDRLYRSASALSINVPREKTELAALLNDLTTRVEGVEQFVYWQITRGSQAHRSHNFPEGMQGNLWITIEPRPIDDMTVSYKVIVRPDTRFLHCDIKTLNLIPAAIASHAAALAGCNETILHRNGVVTECAHSNVHLLKNGTLRTHPADNLILAGIARAHLIAACGRLGVPVEERAFTLDELYTADELIITSSGSFCMRVCEVEGRPVGGRASDVIEALQKDLFDEYRKETE